MDVKQAWEAFREGREAQRRLVQDQTLRTLWHIMVTSMDVAGERGATSEQVTEVLQTMAKLAEAEQAIKAAGEMETLRAVVAMEGLAAELAQELGVAPCDCPDCMGEVDQTLDKVCRPGYDPKVN